MAYRIPVRRREDLHVKLDEILGYLDTYHTYRLSLLRDTEGFVNLQKMISLKTEELIKKLSLEAQAQLPLDRTSL